MSQRPETPHPLTLAKSDIETPSPPRTTTLLISHSGSITSFTSHGHNLSGCVTLACGPRPQAGLGPPAIAEQAVTVPWHPPPATHALPRPHAQFRIGVHFIAPYRHAPPLAATLLVASTGGHIQNKHHSLAGGISAAATVVPSTGGPHRHPQFSRAEVASVLSGLLLHHIGPSRTRPPACTQNRQSMWQCGFHPPFGRMYSP